MTNGQPASEFRYWAFISYSHKDASWGRWLHKALETYRVPRRLVGMPIAAGKVPARLSPIFRDRDELPTTSDLGTAVEEALSQSWCLIVICSPESAQSRWVNEEVLAFRRLGRGNNIHCLIVDGGPDPAAPLCFPPALEQAHAKNSNGKSEPVAADARRFGDGRSHALLKLIAGILGIRYDTLVQREQQRKHRNLFWITCASLALVVVLAASTLIAVTSRRDAVDQRSHAEGLVEFMIGDLRKKLEPDGKLATLDAVGKEALAYYASQKSKDLDAEGLARRARALHMIGEVYDLRGELDEALKVFKQAADSTAELLAREPDNGQRIFDHAQSVFYIGQIANQRGNAAVAEPAFQEYKKLAERLIVIDPTNDVWRTELDYANSNLGALLSQQGKNAEAAKLLESALATTFESSQRAPGDIDRAMLVGQIRAWLADAYYGAGRVAEAIEQRRAETELYSNVIAIDPKNNEAKFGKVVSERALGFLANLSGGSEFATRHFQNSVDLAEQMLAQDPDNSASADVASAAHSDLAEVLVSSGQTQLARVSMERARDISTRLTIKDPSVVSWQQQLARSQMAQARVLMAEGRIGDARELAVSVVAKQDELIGAGSVSNPAYGIYPKALQLAAELNGRAGNAKEEQRYWERIIALLEDQAETLDPSTQVVLASAYRGAHRDEQANALLAHLKTNGVAIAKQQKAP